MKNKLNESLPTAIAQFPIVVGGKKYMLRFDTNVNRTKKGVKLQVVLPQAPGNPQDVQQLANEIGPALQEKFAAAGLQITFDSENPYKNVIGFLLPLPSLADYLVKVVFKQGGTEQSEDEPVPNTKLPKQEEAPEDEALREMMRRIAGI